ncbi:MAG: metallophosphoesterase [Clostridia bacterium]|nr:metallophosphoesterase [Clostridia bacterium]
MKKLIKSRPLPIILMAMSILSLWLFKSVEINWIFINNTLGISWFTTLIMILMFFTLLSASALSAVRVYKKDSQNKKAYIPATLIVTLFAVAFFIFAVGYSTGFIMTEAKGVFICNLKETVSDSIYLVYIGLLAIFLPALSCKAKKIITSLTLVAVLLMGLNSYYPLTPYKITSKPMVIDNGSGYSVVFSTSDRGTAYIEYTFEGKAYKAYDQTAGRLNTERNIHSIKVPYEHLKGNTYTVGSTRVIDEFSYSSRLGKTVVSGEYMFKINESDNQEWLVISDWHTMLDKAYKAVDYMGEYDAVVLLGDATPGVDFEEEVIRNVVQFGGEISEGSMPVIYVRGNHETRGAYANDLAVALGLDEFYYTTSVGDYSFLVLDSGEDKDDSHSEYGGMTDYNTYRASMIEWLKGQEVENDKVIALSHSWKISDVESELSLAGWAEINRLGARMMLSGHNHKCRFLGDGSDAEKEIFGLYPNIVGYLDGGKVGDDYIASKLTLSADGFNIKAVSYTGTEIFDENFTW